MTYDPLDRLLTAASPMFGNGATGIASFTYDVLDNLTKLVMPATATTVARTQYYCYDSNWRLQSLRTATNCGGSAQSSLAYDARGNVATKDGMTFDFDQANRLKSIDNGGVVENYRYDGYGLRALKNASAGNIWSQYTRDGRLLQEVNARTDIQTEYVYLGGSVVAQRETPTTGGTAVVKYQHTDALGTPVAVTNASRTVLTRNEVEPYGQLINHTITDAVGFTGHVQDALTGLTYMQQRYYDPMIGRFLSVDPVAASNNPVGAFNRYDYAGNNPYRFTDPDGRKKIESQIPKNRESLDRHPSNGRTPPTRTASTAIGNKSSADFSQTNATDDTQSGNGGCPTHPLLDAVGKAWTLSNTEMGIIAAELSYVAGKIKGTSPSFQIRNNAIQLLNSPINVDNRAYTLGNVQIYGLGDGPNEVGPSYTNSIVNMGRHEEGHTLQAQILGPYYLPTWVIGRAFGGDSQGNPLESGADNYALGQSCNGF
jgi:RHS repeat-associated protein